MKSELLCAKLFFSFDLQRVLLGTIKRSEHWLNSLPMVAYRVLSIASFDCSLAT